MEKCVLCGREVMGVKYLVPNSSEKYICQNCNDCIALCIANKNDESTQSARVFLNAQMEKSNDPEVVAYLMKVFQMNRNEGLSSNAAAEEVSTPNYSKYTEESGLFGNIGRTIKGVTKVSFWLEVVLFIIAGFMLISQDSYRNPTAGKGFLLLLAGPLIAWLGSLFSYGFGELIEQTTRQNQLLSVLISKSYKNEVK